MPTAASAIPLYALYGERPVLPEAGFVHVEPIEARSAVNNWEIAPHRHTAFCQLFILLEGSVDARIDASTISAPAPVVLIAPPGAVHGFHFSSDIDGHVLTLSADIAERIAGADDRQALLRRGGHAPLAPATAAMLRQWCIQLEQLQQQSPQARPLHLALAEAAVRLALLDEAASSAPADPRIVRLRALIEAHAREHRGVGFYAAALGVTPRSLTRLTTAQLGCSPAQLAERRLMLEARRLLRFSNASVAQVAEALGYGDPSYFARAFRRAVGHGPRAERAR